MITITTKLNKAQYRSSIITILSSGKIVKIAVVVYPLAIVLNALINEASLRGVVAAVLPLLLLGVIIYFSFRWGLNWSYKSNPRVREPISYQMDSDRLAIYGASFQSEMSWDRILKISKTRHWVLLWHGTAVANAIPLECFSEQQLLELKEIATVHQIRNNL